MRAGGDALNNTIQLLRAVADADGEHQERHQHRVWVESSNPMVARMPICQTTATTVHVMTISVARIARVYQYSSTAAMDNRHQEEGHNRHHAVDQGTHNLGKSRDMHLKIGMPASRIDAAFKIVDDLMRKLFIRISVFDVCKQDTLVFLTQALEFAAEMIDIERISALRIDLKQGDQYGGRAGRRWIRGRR